MLGWLVIGGFAAFIYFIVLVIKKIIFEITKVKTTACYTELIDSTPSTLNSAISNIYNMRVDTEPPRNIKFYEELKRIDDGLYEDSKIKLNEPFKVYWDNNTQHTTNVSALNKDIGLSILFACGVFIIVALFFLGEGVKWFGFCSLCMSVISILINFWIWHDEHKKIDFYQGFSLVGLLGLLLLSIALLFS